MCVRDLYKKDFSLKKNISNRVVFNLKCFKRYSVYFKIFCSESVSLTKFMSFGKKHSLYK